MKKEELLDKLRRNITQQFDMPTKPVQGIVYTDVVKEFIGMSKTVGSKVIEVKKGDNLNVVIREACPNAKIFASNVEGIEADLNPDTIASNQKLENEHIHKTYSTNA